MVIDINETKLSTIAHLRGFLEGKCEVRFERAADDAKRYAVITAVVRRFGYRLLPKADCCSLRIIDPRAMVSLTAN
jgi:hypothetical protein